MLTVEERRKGEHIETFSISMVYVSSQVGGRRPSRNVSFRETRRHHSRGSIKNSETRLSSHGRDGCGTSVAI